MKKTVLLFTILFCFVFTAPAQERLAAEEVEVYKAWLENPFLLGAKKAALTKITADFSSDFKEMPSHRRRKLNRVQTSTLDDYNKRNRISSELPGSLATGEKVTLIDDNSQTYWWEYVATDSVKKAGAEFVIAFSRVGFNKRKNQALMHINFKSTTNKYAAGYFFLFIKKNGKWLVDQFAESWVY
jgi:hypothetical protein